MFRYKVFSLALIIAFFLGMGSNCLLSRDSRIDKAEAYRQQGEFKKALKEYNKAVKDNPKNAAAYTGMGEVYIMMREPEDAINAFKKAIEADSQYADAYIHLGDLYRRMDKEEKNAVEAYKKAQEIDPENSDAYLKLGDLYVALGQVQEAITEYKFAIMKDPESTDAYIGLGEIYWGMGQLEDAALMYKEVIKINPESIETYYGLGYFYREMKRYDEALETYGVIVSHESQKVRAYIAIGWSYYDKGDYPQSIEYFQKVSDIRSDNTTPQFNIALAYLRMGEIEKAKKIYLQTKQLSDSPNLAMPLGAIEDLQKLVLEGVAVEAAMSILQEIFEIHEVQPLRSEFEEPDNPLYALTEKPVEIKRVNPIYPELAKKGGVEGTVIVKVLIDQNGNVEAVEALRSHPLLDEAAMDAAWQFKFKPGKQKDKVVKVWVSIPFNFRLKR